MCVYIYIYYVYIPALTWAEALCSLRTNGWMCRRAP